VLRVRPPYRAGLFQVFEAEVAISEPNAPCTLRVPPGNWQVRGTAPLLHTLGTAASTASAHPSRIGVAWLGGEGGGVVSVGCCEGGGGGGEGLQRCSWSGDTARGRGTRGRVAASRSGKHQSCSLGASVATPGSPPCHHACKAVETAAHSSPCLRYPLSFPAPADRAGEATAGSNSLVAVWDTQAPAPTIQAVGLKYGTTDQQRLTLHASFGERVLTLNPLRLFTVSGMGRCVWGGGGCGGQAPVGNHHLPTLIPAYPVVLYTQLNKLLSICHSLGWVPPVGAACQHLLPIPLVDPGPVAHREAPMRVLTSHMSSRFALLSVPVARRMDVLYDVLGGQLFVIGNVSNPAEPTVVTSESAAAPPPRLPWLPFSRACRVVARSLAMQLLDAALLPCCSSRAASRLRTCCPALSVSTTGPRAEMLRRHPFSPPPPNSFVSCSGDPGGGDHRRAGPAKPR
jgi:hypothetical protein